jgi:outer membrane lipoprotein SlyB
MTEHPVDTEHVDTSQPGHADTGTAAGVGGVVGAAIGAVTGPLGAIAGAAGGMLAGAAAERAMHHDDDAQAAERSEDAPRPGATTFAPGDDDRPGGGVGENRLPQA